MFLVFFLGCIFSIVHSTLVQSCQRFQSFLNSPNSTSQILLDLDNTCVLNNFFNIASSLVISTKNYDSNLSLTDNFSLRISPKAELTISNLRFFLDCNSLLENQLFSLNIDSVLNFINVSFRGSSQNCQCSLIRGFLRSKIGLYSCNLLNLNIGEFPLIEIRNYSSLTIENFIIMNLSLKNPIIKMKFNSFLNVSGFQIKTSIFFPFDSTRIFAIIENDYSSYLHEITLENVSFISSFLSFSSNSNLNLTIQITDCNFSQVFNKNDSNSLILNANIDGHSSLKIKNCFFSRNQASFSFFSITAQTVILKALHFNVNHANFSIFYGYKIYSLQVNDTIIKRQNSNQTDKGDWAGSCFIIENSLIRIFNNLTIQLSRVNDSCVGIQFHDTAILSSIFNNYILPNDERDGQIEIQNSFFSENYVFYRKSRNISGILYLDSDSPISIVNCSFEFNIINSIALPEKNIGAPCLNSFSSKNQLSITGSIFKNNSAKFISNCIFFQGYEMNIRDSFFEYNVPFYGEEVLQQYKYLKTTYVRITEALPYGFGGAVHFLGEVLYISNSFFSRNQGYIGGGLLIDGTDFQLFLNLTIENSIFDGNSAGTMGGGIYFTSSINDLNGLINNSIFIFNDGRYGGGITTAYSFDNDYLLINKTLFFQNQAQYVGAVLAHHTEGTINITQCNFFENKGFLPIGMTLPVMGGGVGVWGSVVTYFYSENNYYLKNFVDSNVGGAIAMVGGNFISENDTYEKNLAKYKGSMFSVSASSITVKNSIIFDNYGYASTMIAGDNSFVSLKNLIYKNNTALYKVAFCELSLSSSLFVNSVFVNGSHSPNSGLMNFVDNYERPIEFVNSTFQFSSGFNTLIDLVFSNVVFSKCMFLNNTSSLFGLENSEVIIMDSSFVNHTCEINNFIEGCLFTGKEKSNILVNRSVIQKITSLYQNSLAYILMTDVTFSEMLITDLNSPSSIQSIYIDSSVYLIENSQILDLFPSTLYSIHSLIQITNSVFGRQDDNFQISETIISIIDPSETTITNSTFIYNIASGNGGSLYLSGNELIVNDTSAISIENCTFINSRSILNGGAIYANELTVLIKDCIFSGNIAKNGGGIFFETQKENSTKKLIIKNKNQFLNNTALEGGGGITWINTLPIIDTFNLKISSNKASYGTNFASKIMRIYFKIYSKINDSNILEFDSQTNLSQYVIEGQIPGNFLEKNIKFRYVDYYNQTINTYENILEKFDILNPEEYQALLSGNKPISTQSSTKTYLIGESYVVRGGELTISNTDVYTPPANSGLHCLILKTSLISTFSTYNTYLMPHERIYQQTYNIIIPLTISSCQIGEISLPSSCYLCRDNKFSLNSSETSCNFCPQNSQCPGGAILDIDPGFWRFPKSSTIYSCDESQNNCIGGADSECTNNFIGPLCRTCPIGFYQLRSSACLACDSFMWNVFRMLGVTIALIFVLFLLLKSTFDNNALYDKIVSVSINQSIDEEILKKRLDFQSIYMKILVNYLQIYSFLVFKPFNMVDWMVNYFDFISIFTNISTKFMAFECLFSESDFVNNRLFRFTCINVLFFALVFLAVFALFIFSKVKGIKVDMVDKIYTTCFGVYFMILPSVLAECLRSLSCIKLEKNEYLRFSPVYVCDLEYRTYQYFIVWPLFFCWGMIFPFLAFLYLGFKRKHLYDSKIFRKYNFIYIGYKTKYFYWDLVILFKKFLASLLAISSLDQDTILLAITAMILVYISLFIQFKPFLNPMLNNLEYLACLYLCVGVFINTLITQDISTVLLYILNIFLFLLNVVFFIRWSLQYSWYFLLKYKAGFQKKFPRIANMFGRLYGFFSLRVKSIRERIDDNTKKMVLYLSPKNKKKVPQNSLTNKGSFSSKVHLKPLKSKFLENFSPNVKINLQFLNNDEN